MRKILLAAALAVIGIAGCNQQQAAVKGKDGEALTLNVPKVVSVSPGATAPVRIGITRKQFDGPVTIELAQLPDNVTIVEKERVIAKGASEATFTLKAAISATGQGHAVKVSASGDGMKAGPVEFTVNIAEKTGPDLAQRRQELEQAVQAKLAEANKDIAKLQERAKDAKGAAKVEADATLVKLRKSRDDLLKRLEQARTTEAEAWEELSQGTHNAAQDLQDAARRAWDRMKD